MSAVVVTDGKLTSIATVNKISKVESVGKMAELGTVKKIVSVGREDGKQGVHIASFPCPKVNDKGLTASWKILDALAKGAALLASGRALKAAKMQDRIARQYYDLAKRQWEFYKANYVPLEKQELDEVHAEKKYVADYDTAIKGHNCTDSIFDSAKDHKDKAIAEYCIRPDITMAHHFEFIQSTIRGDSNNFARRYAEFLAEKKDDERWNKKLQVASRGRGLLPQSADYANRSASAFGDYSNAMSGFAGQAIEFSSYIRNRRNTVYNGEHDGRIATRLGPLATSQTGYTPPSGAFNGLRIPENFSFEMPKNLTTGTAQGEYGAYNSADDFINGGTGTFYDDIKTVGINPTSVFGA